jgi:hypothetical protein
MPCKPPAPHHFATVFRGAYCLPNDSWYGCIGPKRMPQRMQYAFAPAQLPSCMQHVSGTFAAQRLQTSRAPAPLLAAPPQYHHFPQASAPANDTRPRSPSLAPLSPPACTCACTAERTWRRSATMHVSSTVPRSFLAGPPSSSPSAPPWPPSGARRLRVIWVKPSRQAGQRVSISAHLAAHGKQNLYVAVIWKLVKGNAWQ